MKKAIILLLAAMLLTSCAEKGDTPALSSNDGSSGTTSETTVSAGTIADISALIDGKIANSPKLSAVGDEYLTGMLELDLTQISEYVLKIQTSGTESDQYGIFKATDNDAAKSLADSVEKYLDTLKASWEQFDYLPEEGSKIKNAEVTRKGSYVLYVIASESEKSAVIDVFTSSVE